MVSGVVVFRGAPQSSSRRMSDGQGRVSHLQGRVVGLSRRAIHWVITPWHLWVLAALMVSLASPSAHAADPEGCLTCHRYRGLSSLDAETGELRLFSASVEYYSHQLGPHARLACTACHARTEVEVFPHEVKTPVDCTQACHLDAPNDVERRFSHREVATVLAQSVHGGQSLEDLPFDPPLIKPGQSSCLYCHDEPLYRNPKQTVQMRRSGDADVRCRSCHRGELPVDTAYYARHVGARFEPQRPVRQLAQVCAVCHSDPVFLEKTGTHDAVASYLHSFHGKAQMLGDKSAATCVDCHAGEDEDVHAMLANLEPGSSVGQAQIAETCRSARCHVGATPSLSAAAVHLQIDPAKKTPEYYLAVFFVLLTAGTLAIFLLMVIFDLIGVVVRRHSADEARLVAIARKLLAVREGRRKLRRLTVHQRFQHWLLAITFAIVALTGAGLKFADSDWAPVLVASLGGLGVSRALHRIAGSVMLLGFAYHIGYLFTVLVLMRGRARAEGRDHSWLAVVLSTRILPTWQDVKDFFGLWRYLFFLSKKRPAFEHFTFLQKFEYWAVTWGCLVIGLSGLVLWTAEFSTQYVSGRTLNFAYIIHSDEAFLAVVYIAAVHMFSVMLAPAVFPLSKGSLTGDAPPEELAEWHRGQVEQLGEALNIEVGPEDLHDGGGFGVQFVKRGYSLVLAGLFAVVLLASMSYLFNIILTRDTAPTSITEIPRTLTLEATPSMSALNTTQGALTRGPLSHYHQIPPWFEDDPTNDCTSAGCHAPLPHGDKVATRAFLNMHTTYIDCGVCHLKAGEKTTKTAWFEVTTGKRRSAPAVMRLSTLLERTALGDESAEFVKTLNALVVEAAEAAPRSTQLRGWRDTLKTTRPGAPVWRATVHEMRGQIAEHLHGEYHAKIGVDDGSGHRVEATEAQREAAQTFADATDHTTSAQKVLIDTAHGSALRSEGLLCTPCHTTDDSLLDYASLGYSELRVKALRAALLAGRIKKIQEGERFHMKTAPGGVH